MTIILCLFIAFFVGVPICFALGIVSIGSLIASGMPLIVTVQRMFTGGDSIALIAIPLFMLSGELMFRGGMSKRLVDFADTLLGHFPSGLAMVSILACMFFAAITGSAIAATAAIGGIMIPLMKERGYEYTFSAPLLACGGSIGPIIPPSIPLLVYGVLASVSVADLYVGGVIPGILMGIGLMIYSYFVGKKRGYMGRETRASFREVVKSAVNALLALFMPVIILGDYERQVQPHRGGGCRHGVCAGHRPVRLPRAGPQGHLGSLCQRCQEHRSDLDHRCARVALLLGHHRRSDPADRQRHAPG